MNNQTEIIILQHPKEREHPFGTARFAELSLANVRTLVHSGLGRSPSPLEGAILREGTALIYPGDGAVELSRAPRPKALLFLDGTWAQSRTLYRLNPRLQRLPQLRIEPRIASRYKIRSEPAEYCTSTVEAIAEALAIVEPGLPGLDVLVEAFESMISRQLDYRSRPLPRRRKARLELPSRAVPELLREGRRIIFAHGELCRGELVYVAAIDLDGAAFELALAPSEPPARGWLERSGLDADALAAGGSLADLPAAWGAFARPEDVLIAWNQSTAAGLATYTGHGAHHASLKAAYCNQRSAAAGTLEAVLEREGLTPEATPFQGRTDRVLGALIPVARRVLGR